MGTLIVLLWACWLLLNIGQIAISDAGVLVSCLLHESDGLCVYAGQDAKQACFFDFLSRCWILKNKHIFLLTIYQNCPYSEGQLGMLQPTMR